MAWRVKVVTDRGSVALPFIALVIPASIRGPAPGQFVWNEFEQAKDGWKGKVTG
jgi:hypothetical protein